MPDKRDDMTERKTPPPMTIGELLKAIGGPNNECNPDTPVYVRIVRPGTVGATPKAAITSAAYGFDWDRGKFILYPEVVLVEQREDQA